MLCEIFFQQKPFSSVSNSKLDILFAKKNVTEPAYDVNQLPVVNINIKKALAKCLDPDLKKRQRLTATKLLYYLETCQLDAKQELACRLKKLSSVVASSDDSGIATSSMEYARWFVELEAKNLLQIKIKDDVWHNDQHTAELFAIAANQGFLPGVIKLARCYEYGKGVEANLSKSQQLYNVVFPLKSFSVNDLEMGEVIGKGAYGTVSQATLIPLDEQVAVKMFHANIDVMPDDVKNELVVMAKLSHPNLIRLYAASYVKPVCIVMEWMNRESLFYLLRAQKVQLTFLQQLYIAHDVAAGLQFLHSQQPKILHR